MRDSRRQSVLDLYCGVGTFSLPLADQAKELTGIELVESSIESAKRNAKDNGLSNTRFIARTPGRGLAELQDTIGKLDLILLDPPRNGAGGKIMRRIGRLQADKGIYISCNPKTLAKDLTWLEDFSCKLVSSQWTNSRTHYMLRRYVCCQERQINNWKALKLRDSNNWVVRDKYSKSLLDRKNTVVL